MRAPAFVTGLVVTLGASASYATPVTYDFTGRVNALSNQPVTVGQLVPIEVTVDAAYPASNSKPGVTQYLGGFTGPSPVLSATMDGVNVMGEVSSMAVDYGASGSAITISSGTPLTDAGFSLSFMTDKADVLTNGAVPLTIDPGEFQSATFRRTVAFNYVYYAGTIDPPAAETVPSPGAAPLLATGLVLLAVARRRVSQR